MDKGAPDSMTMRLALENMVKQFDRGVIEHALVTTFNFDPGFFERNVLPLICGIALEDLKTKSIEATTRDMFHPLKRTKVVVAYDQNVLQGARGGGIRYEILPMHQAHGFFHAKIIVLTGKDHAGKPMVTLMLGSGNMTLSGWAENIEIATWTRVNGANAKELLGFYRYLNNSEKLEPGIEILKMLEDQDGENQTTTPTLFLQYPGHPGGSLISRMLQPQSNDDMHIYSPYWSEKAVLLFRPASDGDPKSMRNVFCYPALVRQRYQFPMDPESVKNAGIQLKAVKAEEGFRHAKVYQWGQYVAVGSANCTVQALETQNNVEAMLRFNGCGFKAPNSQTLDQWSVESQTEEGISPAPLAVLVIADYQKRHYSLRVTVTNKTNCQIWTVCIGSAAFTGQTSDERFIPFTPGLPVERMFTAKWQGNDENGAFNGMVIAQGGTDIEMGFRPKRNLNRIFDDMLRHKSTDREPPSSGQASKGSSQNDDPETDDVDGEDTLATQDTYEFDMYGMYQSFYHLKQDITNPKPNTSSELTLVEIGDTLLDILVAIKQQEITNTLQRWLIMNECWSLIRMLPARQEFENYSDLKHLLDNQVNQILKSDDKLKEYNISAQDLLIWLKKELAYDSQ